MALILRLGQVARTTYTPINDGRTYLILASQVVKTGDYATSSKPGTGSGGTRGPTALFPPAYPYFLAAVDLLDGQPSDLKAAAGPGRVSQAILGTLTVGLIGLVALEAFGGEAALVALVLAAVYPVLIETSAVLLAENLMIALVLAAVYCGLRLRRAAHPYRWIALSGVLTGLAALTHQNALVLLPPLALAAWSSSRTRATRTRGLAVLALATALTVAPWTIRNAVELRSFIPISDQAGETVFGTYNPVSAANTRVAVQVVAAQRGHDGEGEGSRGASAESARAGVGEPPAEPGAWIHSGPSAVSRERLVPERAAAVGAGWLVRLGSLGGLDRPETRDRRDRNPWLLGVRDPGGARRARRRAPGGRRSGSGSCRSCTCSAPCGSGPRRRASGSRSTRS